MLREGLLREIILSTRDHEEREGDLRAQIASLDTGERRMRELIEKYSLEKINQAASGLLDYGERLVRSAIEKIPDGDYAFTDYLEDDGAGTRNIPIRVKIGISGGAAEVDFRGSSKKVRGCLNAPLSVTTSAVLYCFQCLSGEDTPLNSGTLRPIEIRVDEDSVLNARYPSAVVGGKRRDVPEDSGRGVRGARGGGARNHTGGKRGNDEQPRVRLAAGRAFRFLLRLLRDHSRRNGRTVGRRGSKRGAHAHDEHAQHPVEAIERELPVMVESYSVRKGSGGAGRFPGGDGIVRQYRFLEDSHVSLITERRERRPWGARGGEDGKSGRNTLVSGAEEKKLPAKCSIAVKAGEAVRIETPGGGGWGAPVPATFFTIDAHQDIAFHVLHYKRDFENPEVPCMIPFPG